MPKLKVRIAVAVDPHTLEWNCCGFGGGNSEPKDTEKMSFARDPLPDGEQRFWVEAEIEVAPVQVVNGVVSAG